MNENIKEMRGMFLQLGNNMWSDVPVKDWALTKRRILPKSAPWMSSGSTRRCGGG